MPTYEYECLECKHRFDAFQSMTADPLEKCIKCKGKVRRLISAGAGIIFKGSGFYVNDYKKSAAPAPEPSTYNYNEAASAAATASAETSNSTSSTSTDSGVNTSSD